MAISRIGRRWLLALALLWLGLPVGAIEAPAAAGAQTGSAAGPIWLADGSDAAALPETGTPRSVPEALASTAAGSVDAGGSCEPLTAASGRTALRVPARLYLSHCAFLC